VFVGIGKLTSGVRAKTPHQTVLDDIFCFLWTFLALAVSLSGLSDQ
jgi:hypothetical protein